MEALRPATHEIVFDHVDFAYVPGEPVLKQASFTVPNQKLTAIVGDSGSGKSTIRTNTTAYKGLRFIRSKYAHFDMINAGRVYQVGRIARY